MKYNLKYTIFPSNNGQEDAPVIGDPTIRPGKLNKPNYDGDAGGKIQKNFIVSPSILMNWFNSFTLVV